MPVVEKPLFSILVPVYNHERYIGAALDSLLVQTVNDWEAIVVDDGSTDGTPDILDRYASLDSRIRVFRKANGGVSSALNMARDQVLGKWICWLSSDDLFRNDKLSVHEQWMTTHPDARFFCTDSSDLNDATGEIRDGGSWTRAPKDWQVLEMLRSTFIHGNSVCVEAGTMRKAGPFNERLRYAQDYDMWLRLLLQAPVVHIPERTCITRWHAVQVTRGFPDACFFDSACAGIQVLNSVPFMALVQGLELKALETAKSALEQALAVASNPGAFLYRLGPHPLLLNRIQEWVWNDAPLEHRSELKKLFITIVQKKVEIQENPVLKTFMRLSLAMCAVTGERFEACQITPSWIAETWQARLAARGDGRAADVLRYLRLMNPGATGVEGCASGPVVNEAFVVWQQNDDVSATVVYGSGRVALEVVRQLRRAGVLAIAVGCSATNIGFAGTELYVAANDEWGVRKLLGSFGAIDAIVGNSRPDVIGIGRARYHLVFWHDPKRIPWLETRLLRWARTPIVCVSNYSRQVLVDSGFTSTQLNVIRNGYDRAVFHGIGAVKRDAHRMVMAATLCDYKGLDIAIRAFGIVRQAVPDATLQLFGRSDPWTEVPPLFKAAGWISEAGMPEWKMIERDNDGLEYMGAVSQTRLAQAFREASLLIMPSRVPESFGLVSIEAQACGCIPVLPRQGGFPETILDGETGFLYEDNTVEALAKRIVDIWEAGFPSDEQRAGAQAWAEDRFSWPTSGSPALEIICNSDRVVGARRIVAHLLSGGLHALRFSPKARSLRWKYQVASDFARRFFRLHVARRIT